MRIADAALRQQLGIEKGRVKIRPEGYTWHEELTLTDSSALVGYFDSIWSIRQSTMHWHTEEVDKITPT